MKIKTKDFILRPITMKDAQGYLECHQDKEAKSNFMPHHYPKNLKEAKDRIKGILHNSKGIKPTEEVFVIEINGEFAGYIKINELNQKYQKFKANIGFCLNKKFRGKGIRTKALRIVTDYAFKKYKKLVRIEGWCRTFNKASARVMEKAGYKLEGILRKINLKMGNTWMI